MKKNTFLSMLMVGLLIWQMPLQAQDMPKEEEKAWKERFKAFTSQYKKNLAGFRDFIEKAEADAQKVNSLQGEITRLNEKTRSQTSELDNLRTENSNLQDQVLDLQAQLNNKPSDGGGGGGIPQTGLVFTVQIGAYKTINGVDGGSSNNFNAETDGNVTKYMIGIFSTYQEAVTMRDSLRKMGVKDAWIVAYQDGQRVPANEVAGGGSQ